MEGGALVKTYFLAGRATRISQDGALAMARGAARAAAWTTQRIFSSARLLNPLYWRRRHGITGRGGFLEISAAERRRIGQDLHNGLGQELAGIAYMASVLEQKLAAKSLDEATDAARISGLIDDTIVHARNIVSVLDPVSPAPDGLVRALEGMATNVSDLYGISCVFEPRAEVLIENNTVSTHVFRIAQEAVSNAIKHGEAEHVSIRLETAGKQVTLVVEDDGVGLPEGWEEARGMGLKAMRYRSKMIGGTLHVERVERVEGGGTVVKCSFPQTGRRA